MQAQIVMPDSNFSGVFYSPQLYKLLTLSTLHTPQPLLTLTQAEEHWLPRLLIP